MIEFFQALADPDLDFLRYAFFSGLAASAAFGIAGSYVVVRRISFIAGAISHSVLAGIGLALYLEHTHGISWLNPLYGALMAALISAVVIGFTSLHLKQREDTVIGAIWAVGMALGLLFISQTPGYVDPMSYLFGNILMISSTEMWLIILLDLAIIGFTLIFYNKFMAICFDREFVRLRGISANFYYIMLLCLIAVTVVLMVMIVGIVLVIALLTLPAATASLFSRSLKQMMVMAVVFCALFTSVGLASSYSLDLPSGPVVIVLAGIVYASASIITRRLRKA